MRTTRAGFTDEDFYGSNDTDVVHFRYLHKLLRQVPTVTLSDVNDGKFTQYVDHESATSKYGSHTYKTTVTTMGDEHTVSDHVFNPFIDDQVDKFYQDVVKVQIDRLDKRVDELTKVVEQQGKVITDLQGQFGEQAKTLAALEKRLAALEQAREPK
jgi:hypothetical protein